jgi:hypothetical protein
MKKITLLLIVLLLGTLVSLGQITAIFVNDNSILEENTETIYTLLKQNLGTLPYFDAVDSARSPNYNELKDYNLVIWYCGEDEDDLYFWNDANQDNPHLKEYLDMGGNFWIMGSGFLNARFIKPPREFKDGTFLNDYLGIAKWEVETYTDDGGFGVPELVIEIGTPVNTLTLDIITWENPPQPFVDGCELVEGSYGAYIFGPNTYQFHGSPSAFYYQHEFENMTFTFDPATMDAKGDMNNMLSDILRFYEELLSATGELIKAEQTLVIYPNPASVEMNVSIVADGQVNIELIDIIGNVVYQSTVNGSKNETLKETVNVSGLSGGMYFLRLETSSGIISRSVVVAR